MLQSIQLLSVTLCLCFVFCKIAIQIHNLIIRFL